MNTQPLRVVPADSVSAYGAATNPTTGTDLGTITAGSLPAGVYLVHVEVLLSGSIADADRNNVEIRKGVIPLRRVIVAPAANQVGVAECQLALDGATNVSVNAVGNASGASAHYSAVITVTRVR